MNKEYETIKKILTSQKKFHISLGLSRILKILELLDKPQNKIKIIQIAGTNGKGSTSRLLSEILTQAGYKTALFTSPHINKYNERIKINNRDILDKDFLNILQKIENIAQENNIKLTEFELLTAIGFYYFAQQNVEIAIIETGLGGRFDATNVCQTNLFSIITSISKDHTEKLGKTISKIAYEKAGIIKQNCPLVVNKNNKGLKIIKEVAQKQHAKILYPNFRFSIKFINGINYVQFRKKQMEFSLLGLYQKENLKIVLASVNLLKKSGYKISDKVVEKSLREVEWQCRFEWHKDKNLVIDGAHNPSGTKSLRESLDFYFPNQNITWIYGTLKNKNYIQNMKNLFRKNDQIYYFEFDKRCLTFEEFKKYYPQGYNLKDIKHLPQTSNLTVIAGSLYMPNYLSLANYIR